MAGEWGDSADSRAGGGRNGAGDAPRGGGAISGDAFECGEALAGEACAEFEDGGRGGIEIRIGRKDQTYD